MAKAMTKKKTNGNREQTRPRAVRAISAPLAAGGKPPRGVKLKTVSWFTLLFSVMCLLAFMAGRPPAVSPDWSLKSMPRPAPVQDASRHPFDFGGGVRRSKLLSDEALESGPYIGDPDVDKALFHRSSGLGQLRTWICEAIGKLTLRNNNPGSFC